jgi:hypothetical protein
MQITLSSAVEDSYYTRGESGGWPPRLRKHSLTGVEALHSHDIKTSKFMHAPSLSSASEAMVYYGP